MEENINYPRMKRLSSLYSLSEFEPENVRGDIFSNTTWHFINQVIGMVVTNNPIWYADSIAGARKTLVDN